MAKMSKSQLKEDKAKRALWMCLHIINAEAKTRLFSINRLGTIAIYDMTDDIVLNMIEHGLPTMPFSNFVTCPVLYGTTTYYGTLKKMIRECRLPSYSWFAKTTKFIERFGDTVEKVYISLDLWCNENCWPEHFVDEA